MQKYTTTGADLSTFRLGNNTVEVTAIEDFQELHKLFQQGYFKKNDWTVLGGGSNTVFISDTITRVIKIHPNSTQYKKNKNGSIVVRVEAGKGWHDFVLEACERGYWGIENLALIPGLIGSSPIQNIGAYGTEMKDVLHKLEYFDCTKNEFVLLTQSQCKFGYRDSIFKHQLKGKAIITRVWVKLSSNPQPNLSYPALRDAFTNQSLQNLTPLDIAQQVMNIRQSKLPDPALIANVGSFFTNPILEYDEIQELLKRFPQAPVYPFGKQFKTSAAFLIDQAGLKGYEQGGIQVHDKQPLVLINTGSGTSQSLLDMIAYVKAKVQEISGITITPEVNLI